MFVDLRQDISDVFEEAQYFGRKRFNGLDRSFYFDDVAEAIANQSRVKPKKASLLVACKTCNAWIAQGGRGRVRSFCDARCQSRFDYKRQAYLANASPLRSSWADACARARATAKRDTR